MSEVKLVLSNDPAQIRQLVSKGYCPVECSIDGASIVDALLMDHHGEYSHLESVAVRAYRDHYGARAENPRFVGTGVADADMTFAVAALAGLIPHPNRKVADKLPPPVKVSMTKDLSDLAETIGRVDVSPIGLDIPSMSGGDILMTWNAMTSNGRTDLGFAAGVQLWANLTEGNPRQLAPYFSAAKVAEGERRQASLEDLERCGVEVEGVLLLQGSRTFGFPEWYGRDEAASAETVEGWEHSVVLAHLEKGENVTIGCPNDTVAEILFGEGGLKNVFPHLEPAGWGGRESVGGSPRGEKLTPEEAEAAVRKVASLIKSDKQ
ncbi:hypothetical protein KKC60_01075 [Patescibacteria group bacterium]|nr:hypothetical protein [Patescibacteria group bacterium]